MFVFHFNTHFPWFNRTLFASEGALLWKLTLAGPFVTLYAREEFSFLSSHYQTLLPDDIEHALAHGYNRIEGSYLSRFNIRHHHFVLPGEKEVIIELKELLDFIKKHNQPGKNRIASELITPCIKAWQHYLNTSSQAEHAKTARAFLMRGTSAQLSNQLPFSLEEEVEDTRLDEDTGLDMEKEISLLETTRNSFLEKPSELNLNALNAQSRLFFQTIQMLPIAEREIALCELTKLLPETTTTRFDYYIEQHPQLSTMVFLCMLFLIIQGCNSFLYDEVSFFLTIGLLTYGPSLAEKAHAAWTEPRTTKPSLESKIKEEMLLTSTEQGMCNFNSISR